MASASSGSAAGLVLERRVVGVAEVGVLVEGHLAVERLEVPSPSLTSGLTSTSVASSSTKTSQPLDDVSPRRRRPAGKPGRGHDLGGLRVVDPGTGSIEIFATASGFVVCDLLDLHAALGAGDAQVVAVRPVDQEGEVVLLRDVRGRAISTRWTVWPLMSMPRMSCARASASSGFSASFTPPALPRPPIFTCALTTAHRGGLSRPDHRPVTRVTTT